jgi:hypothetical protein
LVVLSGGVGETPTPPALNEHAFGVALASIKTIFNREAIPVDSRGLRRFAATPGPRDEMTTTLEGSPWERA